MTGVARYLKQQNPDVQVIAGDPEGSIYAAYYRTGEVGTRAPYKVEGVGNDKIPATFDFDLIDDFQVVSDRDSMLMTRRLTREEGLFVGGSAGLIVHVAVDVARELSDPDALIVCLLPDTGERYLSKIYSDEWMRENQLLVPEQVTAGLVVAGKSTETPSLIAVEPDAPVRQALELIEEHNVSQLPVIVDRDCVGSVSEANLMSRLVQDPELIDAPVEQVMEAELPVVDADVDFETVVRELVAGRPAVVVRKAGVPSGIITRFDVVHHLTDLDR